MRFTFSIAMLAMCLVALQCTATKASEGNDGPSPPQQPNSGVHTGSGTVEIQQVSPDPPSPDHLAPGIAAPAAHTAAAGKGSKGGDGGESGEGREIAPPPVGAGDPNGSLPAGSSGSAAGAGAGGDAEKTVTITTTSTAANAALINPLPEANQPQQPQGPAQQGHGQGTENAHENPRAAQPKEPQIVITTTTKQVTQLEDKGSAKVNTDSGVEGEQTHQAGPPPNFSTPNAASKQITPTPSRDTVDGVPQHNGGQPSPTPEKRTPVVRDTNTASSSGDEVRAPELPLEPHTEKGVSQDLTKTQHAQEQTPPLSVNSQTPPSTTTVKENGTPVVPATSTTIGTSKDAPPKNNNTPTTSTAGDLKVPANQPAAKPPTDPTNGDKETMPSKQSITSTSEPAQVESTAHLTPLPKLSDALQSLENKDSSIDTFSLFALAALATLVVMAAAPTF